MAGCVLGSCALENEKNRRREEKEANVSGLFSSNISLHISRTLSIGVSLDIHWQYEWTRSKRQGSSGSRLASNDEGKRLRLGLNICTR